MKLYTKIFHIYLTKPKEKNTSIEDIIWIDHRISLTQTPGILSPYGLTYLDDAEGVVDGREDGEGPWSFECLENTVNDGPWIQKYVH